MSFDWASMSLEMANVSLGRIWDLPMGLRVEGTLTDETEDSSQPRSATQIGMMEVDRV